MPGKRYKVTLTVAEREELEALLSRGQAAAYRQRHARVLLKADEGPHGPGWVDERIAAATDVHRATVERVRQRFVEEGLELALGRQVQKNRKPKRIDGAAEAHLVALMCQPPPEGHARWTLRLLADRMVEMEWVDHVCPETVRQALKKTNSSLG